MSHGNLESYYQILFGLMHHHKYNKSDVENMYPFERDLFLMMIHQEIRNKELGIG